LSRHCWTLCNQASVPQQAHEAGQNCPAPAPELTQHYRCEPSAASNDARQPTLCRPTPLCVPHVHFTTAGLITCAHVHAPPGRSASACVSTSGAGSTTVTLATSVAGPYRGPHVSSMQAPHSCSLRATNTYNVMHTCACVSTANHLGKSSVLPAPVPVPARPPCMSHMVPNRTSSVSPTLMCQVTHELQGTANMRLVPPLVGGLRVGRWYRQSRGPAHSGYLQLH
jgi:hypothetical protein